MLAFQILIDGFAISALYALGATGFTLIFGVSGVLNLSHGAIMVLAAVAAWAAASIFHVNTYAGALIGVAVAAYYPDVSLSGVFGYASTAAGGLITASNKVWSGAVSGSQLLFDGGARRGAVAAARPRVR